MATSSMIAAAADQHYEKAMANRCSTGQSVEEFWAQTRGWLEAEALRTLAADLGQPGDREAIPAEAANRAARRISKKGKDDEAAKQPPEQSAVEAASSAEEWQPVASRAARRRAAAASRVLATTTKGQQPR